MVTSGEGDSNGVKRRTTCGCTKDDFLPEESFQKLGKLRQSIGQHEGKNQGSNPDSLQ
ncbi:unnamed protein product [Rhodiola kirilowii]